MKNMIAPEKLAVLMEKPVSFERIAMFLSNDSSVTATQLCRIIGADSQQYFNWKSKRTRRAQVVEVMPTTQQLNRLAKARRNTLRKRR